MIYGTHGEIPKIVMAPSTIEEASMIQLKRLTCRKISSACNYLIQIYSFHLGKAISRTI